MSPRDVLGRYHIPAKARYRWRAQLSKRRLHPLRPGGLMTDTLDRLTAALPDRYRLERELGQEAWPRYT